MSPTFIGEIDAGSNGARMMAFHDGVYGFSNPYSANMFCYLRHKYGIDLAKSAVILYEKKLKESAPAKFKQFIGLEWGKAAFSGGKVFLQKAAGAGVKAALDPKGIIESMLVETGGNIFMDIVLDGSNPESNKYNPTSSLDQYIKYAIKYMAKYPGKGPAFTVESTNVTASGKGRANFY